MNELPEAPVTMFTNYKRTDGFEVSLTLRGSDLKQVATELDEAIKLIATKGGTPVSRQKSFGPAKTVDFVEGRSCPKCGNKLVNTVTKAGKKFIKCETNKWDFANKVATGCDFTEWPQPVVPVRQAKEFQDGEDFDMEDSIYNN